MRPGVVGPLLVGPLLPGCAIVLGSPVGGMKRREPPATGFTNSFAMGGFGPVLGPVGFAVGGAGDVSGRVTGAGGAFTLSISVEVLVSGAGAVPSDSIAARLPVTPGALTLAVAARSEWPFGVLLPNVSELVEDPPRSSFSLKPCGFGIATSSFFSNRGGACAASVSSDTP